MVFAQSVHEHRGTAFRPAAQAILPGLARTPEELAAANVATSVIVSVGGVVGPTLGAIVLAVSNVAAVFVFNASTFFWSAALVCARSRAPGGVRVGAQAIRSAVKWRAGWDPIMTTHPALAHDLYVAQTFVAGHSEVFAVLTALELTG